MTDQRNEVPAGEPLGIERRAELLAVAEPDELCALADACLEDGAPVRVLVAPEVGCVSTQVREPVAGERFLIGDVLACRAEVELAGQRGWAMRLGGGERDRAAVLAAALLDAEARAGRPRAGAVDALCATVARRQADALAGEWAELSATVVEFEELT